MIDYQYLHNTYNNFPFLIKLAWFASGTLVLAIFVLTIYLRLIRLKLRKKRQDKAKFKTEYEALLIEYVYSGDDSGETTETQNIIIEQLKDAIKIDFKRKMVVYVLYDLMNQVSGEMSDAIKLFYFKTGLVNYAYNKLNSKKWHVIAKGIGELRRFRVEEASHNIAKFINYPRREVQKETQLYMVNLFLFDGLSFLDDLKTPLSEWAQIQLLETLQKFENQEICNIRPWLKSTNHSVVSFALKLAQIYNQFEVKDTLMELLSHPNKEIRVNTINVLTHLYGIEAKEMLKANFNTLSIEEQISFFGLLEKLVLPDDEPFIEKHLFHKNFEIQLLALNILKEINIDKYMGFKNLSNEEKSPAMLKVANTL
ncbi:hypothetical protein GCM10023311_12350 [Flaviramulus aquimarinus]|uniref:HEAT repeat domain-containing protein n=1 Tax=Flaviramulus aquimarinus TaxID=1170456 RepID=A0ABP9F752_9FLAO